jgi:hypothetical protein
MTLAVVHATYTMIILGALFSAPIVYFILAARRGKEIYIRPIAGLAAIDEAVGRATEMGKPVLYVSGLVYLDIDGLCSMAILGQIAKLCARYDLRLIVPMADYLLYPIAEEAVREAYAAEGKTDLFNAEDIVYVPGQFPYAAACIGIMHREKVAATFFFGYFYAESLILAEAGNQVGAIHVAGTPSTMQLPFFVTACDYTIIGEEYYAATAYLTKEPTMLGSLVGQDIGKVTITVLIVLGVICTALVALVSSVGTNWMINLLER